jgi:hypothetical protein
MAFSFLSLSCSVVGVRSEETPKYQVLTSEGDKEIRSYSKYVIAKTTVQGDYKETQGEAFRRLAGYIFGKNEKRQKLSMTAPVGQEKQTTNQKLAMTAPVAQSQSEEGWVMTFMMPSEFELSELPIPTDTRVSLEEIPPRILGTLRFSGLRDEAHNQEKAKELKSWLANNKQYEISSEPIFAGYDPPWTLPFFRRNEVMFELRPKTHK